MKKAIKRSMPEAVWLALAICRRPATSESDPSAEGSDRNPTLDADIRGGAERETETPSMSRFARESFEGAARGSVRRVLKRAGPDLDSRDNIRVVESSGGASKFPLANEKCTPFPPPAFGCASAASQSSESESNDAALGRAEPVGDALPAAFRFAKEKRTPFAPPGAGFASAASAASHSSASNDAARGSGRTQATRIESPGEGGFGSSRTVPKGGGGGGGM